MADICLECWNKINAKKYTKFRYVLSKEYDLCDCCGKWTNVIVCERKHYYKRKFIYAIRRIKLNKEKNEKKH